MRLLLHQIIWDKTHLYLQNVLAKGTGRTNLMNHLATTHPTYQSIMAEKKDPSSLKQYFTPKSSNICGWLDWIITNGLPFSSVSDPLFRKYSNLESISVETYMKYMALLTISVEDEIRNLLPDVFSLIFDGWTLDGTSTHFIALYASFMVIIFIFIWCSTFIVSDFVERWQTSFCSPCIFSFVWWDRIYCWMS